MQKIFGGSEEEPDGEGEARGLFQPVRTRQSTFPTASVPCMEESLAKIWDAPKDRTQFALCTIHYDNQNVFSVMQVLFVGSLFYSI